jgi:hypothetical protein
MTFIESSEIAMLVLFGVSWPFNIIKSYRSRTAKGKSVLFELIVVVGYLFGLSGKFVAFAQTGHMAISVWFYIADIVMVSIDMVLYRRNILLDRERDAKEAEEKTMYLQKSSMGSIA